MPGNTSSYLRPGTADRIFGRALVFLVWIGLIRGHFYVLEVRGRKSGKTISLPVDPLDLAGQRYLVCARGNSNWVRNTRAAGEVVLVRALRRRRYAVRELPPDLRPPVLKAYLDRFAGEVQRFFPVPKGSAVEAFNDLAPRYPVFQLEPSDETAHGAAPTLRSAIIIVAATLAYLGLAVLGWGGVAAFFSHPSLIALAIALFALSGAALFSRGNLSAGEREDRSNRWVIPAFVLIGLLSGYLPAYTDRIGFWTLDGDAIRWLGVVLFAAGGALRIWPVFVLGRRFSGLVAIQPGHSLVTNGVYGVIRHPSYLGLLVSSLGWALAFRSGIGLLLTALTIPPLLARIHAEETLLRAHFGSEYSAYCSRTSRLIPGLY